jgi:hypothetical protein
MKSYFYTVFDRWPNFFQFSGYFGRNALKQSGNSGRNSWNDHPSNDLSYRRPSTNLGIVIPQIIINKGITWPGLFITYCLKLNIRYNKP